MKNFKLILCARSTLIPATSIVRAKNINGHAHDLIALQNGPLPSSGPFILLLQASNDPIFTKFTCTIIHENVRYYCTKEAIYSSFTCASPDPPLVLSLPTGYASFDTLPLPPVSNISIWPCFKFGNSHHTFVCIFFFISKGSGTSSPFRTAGLLLMLPSQLLTCLNSLTSTPAHSAQFIQLKHARSAMVMRSPTIQGPSAPAARVLAAVRLLLHCSSRRSSRT